MSGGEVLRIPAFARYWTADTVGAFVAMLAELGQPVPMPAEIVGVSVVDPPAA
jgi:hypothetical protein